MDLSTTRLIKRRRFEVNPAVEGLTNCYVDGVNFFENRDLSNIKFRISSFYVNNSSLATFSPDYIKEFPSSSVFNNLAPNIPVNINLSPPLTNTMINYSAYVYNPTVAVPTIHVVLFDFTPIFSRFPNNKPLIKYSRELQQYTDKYFNVYDTTVFTDLIATQLSAVLSGVSITPAPLFMAKTDSGYAMYVRSQIIDSGWVIGFSKSLINLFTFQNRPSNFATDFYDVKLNNTVISYQNAPSYSVFTQYISDKWNLYDSLVFKTNLPVEKTHIYDNSAYTAKAYENTLLFFKIGAVPYNYFTSAFSPDENWTSMVNTNSGENQFLNLNLRIRKTNDIVPFTIEFGEKYYVETEEVDTY